MIPVSQPYLPDRKRFLKYVKKIYNEKRLTNNGPLVHELTARLEEYLGVDNLLLVNNGTTALQIAYYVLGINEGCKNPEAITTPFSFIATSSSLKWQGIRPVFSDIEPDGWCLDPNKVEEAITPDTRGIVPVHVFGNGCNVNALDSIAERHDLKVVYDAAHAFGITHDGNSILRRGDASILSFHATKLFHTIEGGAIVFKKNEDLQKARAVINFGIHEAEVSGSLGINAKMNEFQAAMGLCVLDDMTYILEARKVICEKYREMLEGVVSLQVENPDCNKNHCYFPILVDCEETLLCVRRSLEARGYLVRRYFYPSLDELSFLDSTHEIPVSKSVSKRVLCLPVFPGLKMADVENICRNIIMLVAGTKPLESFF